MRGEILDERVVRRARNFLRLRHTTYCPARDGRRSDSEYAKKASISKPLKSRGNAPRPRYVDSQSFMFCRWAPQYAHRISGQQVLDQPWGKRCQALELPRESSGTFGAGSGWLLRLTTDQMRRERGG